MGIYLMKLAKRALEQQLAQLKNRAQRNEFLRKAMLAAVDDAWVEQVDYLQQLQMAVSGRSTAQRNPVYEYQMEARDSFSDMKTIIVENIARNVLLGSVWYDTEGELQILLP